MTSLVKTKSCYQNKICQIVPLLMFKNFTPHKYFVQIKLSCSKRRWKSEISKTEQHDVNKWRHKSKTRHGIKKIFCQNLPLVMLNNFTYHKYFLKINLSCKKRRWSGKISKIEQNNVKNGVIGQKKRHFVKNWSCQTTLFLIYIS